MLSGGFWKSAVNTVRNIVDPEHDYWCYEGTKKDGKSRDSHDDRHKCKSCNDNHSLINEKCRRYYLHSCQNGTPVDDKVWTPEEQDNICKECNSNYGLYDNKDCELLEDYICPGGTPKSGGILLTDIIAKKKQYEATVAYWDEWLRNRREFIKHELEEKHTIYTSQKNTIVKVWRYLRQHHKANKAEKHYETLKAEVTKKAERDYNQGGEYRDFKVLEAEKIRETFITSFNKNSHTNKCVSCNDRNTKVGDLCPRMTTALNWDCPRKIKHNFLPNNTSIDSYHYLSWLALFGLHKNNLPNIGFVKDGTEYYIDIEHIDKPFNENRLPNKDIQWTLNGKLYFSNDDLEWGPNSTEINCKIILQAGKFKNLVTYQYYSNTGGRYKGWNRIDPKRFIRVFSPTYRVISGGAFDGNSSWFYINNMMVPSFVSYGLNILVLKDNNHEVHEFRNFNKYQWEVNILNWVRSIPTGRIVLVSAMYDMNCHNVCKQALKLLGSTVELNKYQSSYVLIGIKNGPKIFEQIKNPREGPIDTGNIDLLGIPAGHKFCSGFKKTSETRPDPAEAPQGYIYINNVQNMYGSTNIQANIANGYWCEGGFRTEESSDSEWINNGHQLINFSKSHSRTQRNQNFRDVIISRFIGIVDITQNKYWITIEDLDTQGILNTWPEKCDNNNNRKCNPAQSNNTIPINVRVYEVDSNGVWTGKYNVFSIEIYFKDVEKKNIYTYDKTQTLKDSRFNGLQEKDCVYFKIIAPVFSANRGRRGGIGKKNVVFMLPPSPETSAALHPERCGKNKITINNTWSSKCENCPTNKKNDYEYGVNALGNKNTCINYNNIVCRPGLLLKRTNNILETANTISNLTHFNECFKIYNNGQFYVAIRNKPMFSHERRRIDIWDKERIIMPQQVGWNDFNNVNSDLVLGIPIRIPPNRFGNVNAIREQPSLFTPSGRIFIESNQQEHRHRPPGSFVENNYVNNDRYDTENMYFPYITIYDKTTNTKYVSKAGEWVCRDNDYSKLWWYKNNQFLYKGGGGLPDPNRMILSNRYMEDFKLNEKSANINQIIIPGGYIHPYQWTQTIYDDLVEDDFNLQTRKITNYKKFTEENNNICVITDNITVNIDTGEVTNAYYKYKQNTFFNIIKIETKNKGRFYSNNKENIRSMKDYINKYNNRNMSYEALLTIDINTLKQDTSPFAQPQKEIICNSGEIIKFHKDKPHTIEILKNDIQKKKYNPYGKRYSPYNEVFKGPYNSTKLEYSEYIDIDLEKKYTIIGIGIKNNSNTKDEFCAIGYGYDTRLLDTDGFKMNYIFNKDKKLYKYDHNKQYISISGNPIEDRTNYGNDKYIFKINNETYSGNNTISVIKIQPCIAQYIRIFCLNDDGWTERDYYVIIQEERYYITNDITVNVNSNWIQKDKNEFLKKYNIEIDQKQNISGGGKKVQKGKYIKVSSRENNETNLKNSDNRLYDCPVGTYSDGSLQLGDYCKSKTTHCTASEYLSVSNNEIENNKCISGYDDINNNIINRKKSYNNTKVPNQNRLIRYNGDVEKNQWWFYNRSNPLDPGYSDFYIEKNNIPAWFNNYNNGELIYIDGSPGSPLHNKRSYTFTLRSDQICPKKLYNKDGISNIWNADGNIYSEAINRHAQFDIKEISNNNGIKTYRITRMDPSPYPNEENKDIEPPRNLDFKLIFTCNYNNQKKIIHPETIINPDYDKCKSSSAWNNDSMGVSHNKGRLDSTQAWSPAVKNLNQWWQFDLNLVKKIKGIITQGRYNYPQFVKTYKVKVSNDELSWTDVDNGNIFIGNDSKSLADSSLKVVNEFSNPVEARYVRIYPQTWHSHPSMRSAVLIVNTFESYDVIKKRTLKCPTGHKLQLPEYKKIHNFNQQHHNAKTLTDKLNTIKNSTQKGLYFTYENDDKIYFSNNSNYIVKDIIFNPSIIDFKKHALENGWHILFEENPLNIFINNDKWNFNNNNNNQLITQYENLKNNFILHISENFDKNISDLKNEYKPLRFNYEVTYRIKSNTDLDNSIVIIPKNNYKNLENSTILEKMGVRELVSENITNNLAKGTTWKFDNIYINNNKNIICNIISVELPYWNFNNNIYNSQYKDQINNNMNSVDTPNISNNIELIKKANTNNIYYLKNPFKNEYLYIKTSKEYQENGKSILWHKGNLPNKEEDLINFEFEIEIINDNLNMDLSILYSPFNISKSWNIFEKEYYIEIYNLDNNTVKYLTIDNDKKIKANIINERSSSISWNITKIVLNDYGNMKVNIQSPIGDSLSDLVYIKVGNNFTLSTNIIQELEHTGEYNTYYIKRTIQNRTQYLYYDNNNNILYWEFINIPDKNNYKFKFIEKIYTDNIPTATTIDYTTGINQDKYKEINNIESTLTKLHENFKNTYNNSEQKLAGIVNPYIIENNTQPIINNNQQNYLFNNKCVICGKNEYIDIPNHDFEKCFPKTQCDNNQKYVNYNSTSVINDNNCTSLDYFIFRKKQNTLDQDTESNENRQGKFVTNIDSIIVSLGLIICFWNIKTTYLYLKNEFDLEDISIFEEIKNNSRKKLIEELKKKNDLIMKEKKFKWMLLKIFQIQKIWKFNFENINSINNTDGKITEEHLNILKNKDMSGFLGIQTNIKLDENILTSPFFNIEQEVPIKIAINDNIALYNVHTKKYLSINKSDTNNIIQSEISLKGNILKNNINEIFWTVINGGTGVDNNNNNNIKIIGLYNVKHKKLLINEKINIKTESVNNDSIENYKRINENNHILDYNFQHLENARFIIEDAGNGKIKLKTNYIDQNTNLITSSYLGINNTINTNNYKGYDIYDEKYCSFDIVYNSESNNSTENIVNNTENISNENSAYKLINHNNFDIFFKKIFMLEEYIKIIFINILYYYHIYYLEGCNNDHLVHFNLENNYTDNSLYKKYIKKNLRTLKVLIKIFDLKDDLYNIASGTNIINNYLGNEGKKLSTLHQQCIKDQYENSTGYTDLNIDDINLNIDGYNDIDNIDNKNRLNNSLKSLNNVININNIKDTKLFRNDNDNDNINDKLEDFDEHKLMCTKNDERYVKCNLVKESMLIELLENLKNNTKTTNKYIYEFTNSEFYDYYTEINNLTLITKNINKKNINDRIFEVNKLYKLLNKGCRSPVSELTNRDTNNNYTYKEGNIQFNKLNNTEYQDIDNDIISLEDSKLNTKQKCYDFISSKDGSNNVDLCCNNTACIPDCDDYKNRNDIKVSDNENIISNLNTYSIDKKYDELYKKTNYNIDKNTSIMEDKYNLTELGCYKNLGTIDNYNQFIPTISEYNNKTDNNYDLNNIEVYGNKSEDFNNVLDDNIKTHSYASKEIINSKDERNNKTKTIVDNIKYKLDNAHIDYGKSENKTENIDICLPRINIDYLEYPGIRDNSFKISEDLPDSDKNLLKKSYNYDIENTNDTLNFENVSPKYLRDYQNNINNNINNIKNKQSNLPNKIKYLDSIGCYNDTPYREYLVEKHFNNEKLECNKNDLTNNNCIINNYNEEYNKTKYKNQRDTLNEEKYIKAYKLCRGENYKNINNENNDNLIENNIKYHLYYRKKYMNSFSSANKDRKLKVLKILYYKLKNNKIEDDDKYYNYFFKNNMNDLSIKRNIRLMVEIFRDIINLSEIKYWANLLKVFYNNNKIEYPEDNIHRKKFLKLIYLNLNNQINILEFLHTCSFNLKINLKIFGDKHVTEYIEIRHDIEYDKNIWRKMRAKQMNELFYNAENIKRKNIKKNNDENISLECPRGTSQQGDLNADISGCGITGCNEKRTINTIENCKIECIKNNDCKAFTYAPIDGDKDVPNKPVCTLYDSFTPTDTWGLNQIFCKIEKDQSYQDNYNNEPSETILNDSSFIDYDEKKNDKNDFSLKS